MYIGFMPPFPEFDPECKGKMPCVHRSPYVGYRCTLARWHDGNHRASGVHNDWLAQWDNDRKTDQHPFFVTFGQQYSYEIHPRFSLAHPDGWLTLYADNEDDARKTLFEVLDQKWSFIYDPMIFPRDLFPLGELAVFSTSQIKLVKELLDVYKDYLPTETVWIPDLRKWMIEA